MLIKLLRDIYQKNGNKKDEILQYFISKAKDLGPIISINTKGSQIKKGDLSGIPFYAKDNFCSVDNATSVESNALKNFNSKYNADVIESLCNSGANFLGTTSLDEFSMGSGGLSTATNKDSLLRNPWSPKQSLIPGGSSSGSAIVIAKGASVFSIASDTGGSVRLPAAFCGVCGFKPTYGMVSRRGLIPLTNTFDCPSIISQYAQDIGIIFNKWIEGNTMDPTLLPKSYLKPVKSSFVGVKIGFIPELFEIEAVDLSIKSKLDSVLNLMTDRMQVDVKRVELVHIQTAVPVYEVLSTLEIPSNMSRFDGIEFGTSIPKGAIKSSSELYIKTRSQLLGEEVKRRILLGNYLLNQQELIERAQKLWMLINQDFEKVFGEVDFILAPVHTIFPPTIQEFRENKQLPSILDCCTCPVNLAGLPAISIPVGLEIRNGQSLPIGLQLIGPKGSDLNLLKLSEILQEIVNFPPLVDSYEEINNSFN